MIEIEPQLWDGSHLGSGPWALYLCESQSQGASDLGTLLFAALSNGQSSRILLRDQCADFLRLHADQTLICCDAAKTHWLLHECFEQSQHPEDMELLWNFTRDFRLVDVSLLDQEVRRIQGDGFPPLRDSLSRLAGRHIGLSIPGQQEFQCRLGSEIPKCASKLEQERTLLPLLAALAIWRIYEQLLINARGMETEVAVQDEARWSIESYQKPPRLPWPRRKTQESHETAAKSPPSTPSTAPPNFRSRGPLGTGMDVCAAIALFAVHRNGLRIKVDGRAGVSNLVAEKYRKAATVLRANRQAAGPLPVGESLPSGTFQQETKSLLEIYKAITNPNKRSKLLNGWWEPSPLPDFKTGSLADQIWQLGVWRIIDPDLAAFADLAVATETWIWLQSAADGEIVRPRYDAHGPIRAIRPSFSLLNDLNTPCFEPRSGYRFLVLEAIDLPLSCLIVLYRSWRPYFTLYDDFAQDADPIRRWTERLRDESQRYFGPHHVREFWQANTHREAAWWIEVTRRLLEVLPLGLESQQRDAMLRNSVSLEDISLPHWKHLVAAFMRVSWELRDFMGERHVDALRVSLGIEESSLGIPIDEEVARHPDNLTRHDAPNFRPDRQIVGLDRQDLLQFMDARQIKHEILEEIREGRAHPVDLTKMRIRTATGRLTGRWQLPDARRQAWELLISDVFKRLAFRIVAAGHRVVAADGHTLVIETTHDAAPHDAETSVANVCRNVGVEILGVVSLLYRTSWCNEWPTKKLTISA